MAVSSKPRRRKAPAQARPLTHRSARELAAAIRAGETSAREVVEAHVALLRRVNPTLNAVVADRYDAAFAEADAADARVAAAEDPATLPPLLGVPCTIKESIALAGMPNSAGLVARAAVRATESAPAAQRLVDAGAIPLGVTNTSELCMWIESDNRLYGRTSNAYDSSRIAGGSSGGEGAAVGSGGSPVGLGSDVGGSIRGPAFFNGVFGHKPSLGLVPMTATYPPASGEITRMVANGPLVRRAEDLMPVLRLLSGPDGVDPVLHEDPQLGDPGAVKLRGLRVLISDEAFNRPISPELLGAREQAAGALAAAGAVVERISMRKMRNPYEPFLTSLGDGDVGLHELIVGEGADPVTLRGLLSRRGPHTTPTRVLLAAERLTARSSPRRAQRAIEAGRAFAADVATTIGDGVMLHPPYQGVAPRHGRTVGRLWWAQPMAVFNLAAVPVTQVPLGLGREGLPLGVQVAAAPGRDHVSIAVAVELERVFGGWVPPVGA
ncbi:MAG TPA: amidase [Conexibacter sp.]|jgi:fatty acid amide hydrolase 2|nr:amidase [Conexibacter sp.]